LSSDLLNYVFRLFGYALRTHRTYRSSTATTPLRIQNIRTHIIIHLYIYNSSVRVYVTELLLSDWTDFDEIFCVCFSGSLDGLDSQLEPVGGAAIGL
jgi:hypothetical protein